VTHLATAPSLQHSTQEQHKENIEYRPTKTKYRHTAQQRPQNGQHDTRGSIGSTSANYISSIQVALSLYCTYLTNCMTLALWLNS